MYRISITIARLGELGLIWWAEFGSVIVVCVKVLAADSVALNLRN